ncbi:hypothetical protein [Flavobacterium dankookense]|uniref:Uncharacterized protein n=1 Tax=Flavobacterium dankookense TaxID=706186 RepID=A0A4R6QF29_9FLAO|nr:hypothetical protein [Flavobacterium dankookense]TDP60089.1 hypothetical protein BC748_1062 [Flavobacterium dankookense]
MEEINGIPLVFDEKQDDAFLGNLFPNGLSFPTLEPTENTIWKEEWKLKSPEEIQKHYFPEAIVNQKNNIALCDTTGVFKNVKIQENIKECPCEKDENGNCNCDEVKVNLPEVLVESFIHGRKILTLSDEITIWFFSSSDGAKLLRAQKDFKESSSRYPDVLAVFMETDDSFNVLGTVMDFVIGANVKSFFKGDTHWEKVLDFMEKNEIHVSKKDAKKLFDNALSHYGFFKFWRDLFSNVKGKAVAVVLEGIAEASDKIANGIADWKFKEEDWDTSLPGFSHKNAPFIILSGNKHGVVINQKVRSKTKNEILERAKKMKAELEQNKRKIPVFIYEPLQKLILMATDETYLFYEVMQSFYKEFVTIVEAGQEWMNAFLCGLINGFLDFISGIFSFIGFFLKAVKNYADYKQNETFYHAIVLEYAENFIQAMASFDCIAFFKQVLSLPLEMLSKFIALTKSINITFNGSKIAYFTGYIIFAIVQILLEIIFTGGSATVERLFAKAGSSVKNVLKKASNLVDDVFEALSHLIDQIKKGANNFAAYVKKIIDDFFKWLEDLFKSGKADELSGMAENISTRIKISVEEFEEGLLKLSKIKPKEALEHLDEALIYFNHHVVDGKILQVSNTNCVNVVESVEGFLKTGKIVLAKPSRIQYIKKLEDIYKNTFLSMGIPSIKKVMKEGERGIIYGIKNNQNEINHVFNVVKKDGDLIFIDAQRHDGKANLSAGYKSFKYLKTN